MEMPVRRLKKNWKELGPGLVTGAADDDPSGIATYSQTGAQYGFSYLWLAPITYPLMAVVQEMCARIGLVTGRGLAENIRREYPRPVLWFVVALLLVANTFNIGADIVAMSAAMQLFLPIPTAPLVVLFALLSLMLQIFVPYQSYARYLKYLTFALFSYVITGLLIGLDWGDVLRHAVTPTIVMSRDSMLLICGILGTTISPYLFFWQSSQEVEEEIVQGKTTIEEREGATHEDIREMRVDVWSGITDIRTAADAAAALAPLAGKWASVLFTIGILGTGFLAIPVLAGSSAYAVAETMHWHEGLFNKFREAIGFYGVIACSMAVALFLGTVGIDPMKALLYAAVANGLVAPVMLFFVVRLASDGSIMGDWVSSTRARAAGWVSVSVMVVAGVATIWSLVA
jgi:Mn2+/Fe2+ NRAMP family transporter